MRRPLIPTDWEYGAQVGGGAIRPDGSENKCNHRQCQLDRPVLIMSVGRSLGAGLRAYEARQDEEAMVREGEEGPLALGVRCSTDGWTG